ncbi:hypothetical protein SSX86_004080 [Deinandra increscens subsp. villosa]|uniref:RING-type E3 ubiquitin transferase n=1 Tax=Deinandra increscens subsp. villosa TaxID=3103831 RepID=A0AAP0H8I3_9ASTR
MKFFKEYGEYMLQIQDQKKLPGVDFKNLKKMLKQCRSVINVCDGSFFPSLMKEMCMVVGSFNEHAQKVLDVHLATGFRKYFVWCRDKVQGNPGAVIKEGKDLVGYAIMNAIAMRKILKKYDKIHDSKQGEAFRSQVQSMHMDILQSPWLFELIALDINLRETKGMNNIGNGSELFEGCSLIFKDGKPTISCELCDAVNLEIDLTCSICLDTVFDPVYLTCGHIFCFMCACKSGSVTIVDGLKATHPTAKCPLCREAGVYHGSLHLEELNILLGRSCPEYWEKRLKTERVERLREAKEHWESQSRAFLGI